MPMFDFFLLEANYLWLFEKDEKKYKNCVMFISERKIWTLR